jgi:hypothetical protein
MSSEVHAKWMNSEARRTSAFAPSRSLSQYSIALTSWLVRASIALTCSASAGEKSATTASSSASVAAEKGAISAIAASAASALSQETSTRTRLRIRPYSEKWARSAATLSA